LESFLPLVQYILPDFILTYFELLRVEKMTDVLHVYLEEKNYAACSEHKKDLLSKGFCLRLRFKTFRFEIRKSSYTSSAVVGWTLKPVELSNAIGN